MTNQEAIEALNLDGMEIGGSLKRVNEFMQALAVAVEVLENSPAQMSGTSDLISKQAAIDAIEEYTDRLQMVNWKENLPVPYKVHALNWCINTIRDLPSASQSGWIPCSERLPDESEWAASYIRSKYSAEFIVMLQGANRPTTLYLTKDGKWFDDSHEFYENVISWMPLPEPYKPEENRTWQK